MHVQLFINPFAVAVQGAVADASFLGCCQFLARRNLTN